LMLRDSWNFKEIKKINNMINKTLQFKNYTKMRYLHMKAN